MTTTSSEPVLGLMATPVHTLIRREPVCLPPQASIREAAQAMCEQNVSSILIVEQGLLFGLVTDRDLRDRAVAAGMDTQRPILDIATLAPFSVGLHSPAFEALLLMARHNIHHVPVLDEQRIVGMITATDLTEQHSASAVYLVGEIHRQHSVKSLQQASARVPRLQQSLVEADASALSTGQIVTAITDAITIRLLHLAEAQLGPAPVDFVWIAAGSQGRQEQTARTDQDNCMVLDDAYDATRHGSYFKALARFVCDGLNDCGYVHCPGEMMACNDTWRIPVRDWIELFAHWTSEPDPTALMLTCVFFDMRAVHGNTALLDGLRANVLERTRGNTIFLAHMVSNALSRQPALGLFRRLAPLRSGEHKGTIDLKLNGIAPIVDLARVHALAQGHAAVNTHERLLVASEGGPVGEQSARDLREALEFLASLRIRHQARQIAQGLPPDNFLDPQEISNFERTQLKDAFSVVQTLQTLLGQQFEVGRF
ncbi:putative nucleotidyltransferase substrate binding domain-containing protein [Hydrogenophaga sp.]|jgi:CBS domain-containing protein|uniref:putative nucleotidyltransferase substrate binding domain-containing protein n=1 Tax=Hydrogenophaga sp. TaxID=1904254 RepID=UPI003F6E6116